MKTSMFLAALVPWLQAPVQDGHAPKGNPAIAHDGEPAVDVGAQPDDVQSGAPARAAGIERYNGPFAEGMAELRRRALDGDTDGALALADALLVPGPFSGVRSSLERGTDGLSERAVARLAEPLEWLGVPADESTLRAEVHYARGLVHAQRAELEPSQDAFELARVLAGPGETRLDAVYNQGTLHLLVGESLRQMIPEIAGQNAVEPPEDMEADPLEAARAAYLAAREKLVERLASDWRDADARANVELALRRLAELDEVERQREEQEQQQEEQDEEQDQEQDQDGEQKSDEQKSDEQKQDESEEQQDQEGEQEPEDEQDSEEQESEDEQPSDEEGEEQQQEPQPQPQEEHLTEEEVKRLLERLQELDEKGEKLRERLRGVRRVRVKRDW